MTEAEALDQADAAYGRGAYAEVEQIITRQWPDRAVAPADAKHVLGMSCAGLGRIEEAETLLRAAVSEDPTSLRHNIALGHILMLAGNAAQATLAYDAALRIDRTWPGLALSFSHAAYRAGRLAEAENAARFALQQQKSADAWNALSGALRGQGKGQEALSSAEEALKLDGKDVGALNSKGAALLLLNRPQEALEIFKQLEQSGVESPVLSLNTAAALEMLGRRDEADVIYDAAAKRWPSQPNLQQQIEQRRAAR